MTQRRGRSPAGAGRVAAGATAATWAGVSATMSVGCEIFRPQAARARQLRDRVQVLHRDVRVKALAFGFFGGPAAEVDVADVGVLDGEDGARGDPARVLDLIQLPAALVVGGGTVTAAAEVVRGEHTLDD